MFLMFIISFFLSYIVKDISIYLFKLKIKMNYDVLTSLFTDNILKKIIVMFSESCLFIFCKDAVIS